MYNLFISHSWSYENNYIGLCNLLDDASYFTHKNYSVSKDDPIRILAKNDYWYENKLRIKLREQMKYASIVPILAGVYASYSDSIDMEISIAKELVKPIIAIEPWGAERTSAVVKNNAKVVVAWNTNSIVKDIREYSL
ncbi:MAG: TIR domain-containing protein [Bacilli bacterium]|jgi:hypothetical protein|nr:TIR domain-containing protein [Bacilli bacterium]MCH4236001.1 TIR domain-containing protein [Bacilli bacterium]